MDQSLADIGIISAYRFADDGSALWAYQVCITNYQRCYKTPCSTG
jgi:hypothetical protein